MVMNSCRVQIKNSCWVIFELLWERYFSPVVVRQCIAAAEAVSALLVALYLHTLFVMEQTVIWSSIHCQSVTWETKTRHARLWQVAFVIGISCSTFPLRSLISSSVTISSVLLRFIFSQVLLLACCCPSSKSSSLSPRAASIQQQQRRTAVCAENRVCPLSSHALADCIHLSNWGWHLLCIQSQGPLHND